MADLIKTSARSYGISGTLALEIARCESNVRQYTDAGSVLRGHITPKDVGVFQINEDYHLERSRQLGFDIYTPNGNVEYALWLMKHEGTKHWIWSKKCWGNSTS